MQELNVASITHDSIVDGPGLRYVVFVQGCIHNCRGCHNPKAIPFSGGAVMHPDEIMDDISRNPLLSGVTFSGGEPFCQAEALCGLAEMIRDQGLGLWIYSGYTFEQLLALKDQHVQKLLSFADALVDGPFVLEKRTLAKRFAGSENQRIIDVRASLEHGGARLLEY